MYKSLLRIAVLFAFSGVAYAQSYVGIDGGYNMIKFSEEKVRELDFNGPGLRLYFGQSINEQVGWEAGYVYLGSKERHYTHGTHKVSLHAGELSLKYRPLTQMKQMYIKGGGLINATSVTRTYDDGEESFNSSIAMGFVVGAGADFPVNDKLSLGVQYNFYYTTGKIGQDKTDAGTHTFGAGLKYAF